MSIEAMSWALNTEISDPIAKLVLIGLANHARADGTASWPAKKALAKYAGATTRTVVTKLQMLEDLGLIMLGDQRLTEYMRADRRPRVWDLQMPRGEALSPREDDYVRGERVASPRTEPRGEAPRSHGVKTVSPEPSFNRPIPTGSARAPAPVDNPQTLIAEWIDHCPGGRPPGRVVGQIAKEITAMLDEGIPYEQVRRGLASWQNKRLHPSVLASVVHEMRTANGHSQPVKERIICKTCQRPEVACRRVAQQTGDDHEWSPFVTRQ